MSNLIAEKPAILEKPRLAGTLRRRLRSAAEFLAPGVDGNAVPVDVVLVERARDAGSVDAALTQVGRDAPRPVAAPGTLTRISLGEARVVLQAVGSKFGERLADVVAIMALAREFLAQLPRAVLAARECADSALARVRRRGVALQASASSASSSASSAAMPVERGMAWARMAVSSSADTAGLSFRNCRAFSLPWPRRSPL